MRHLMEHDCGLAERLDKQPVNDPAQGMKYVRKRTAKPRVLVLLVPITGVTNDLPFVNPPNDQNENAAYTASE